MPVHEFQLPFVFLGELYNDDRGGGALIAMLDVPGPYTIDLRAQEAYQRAPSAGRSLRTNPVFSYEPELTLVVPGAL